MIDRRSFLRPKGRRIVIQSSLKILFQFAEDRKATVVDKICDKLSIKYFRHGGNRYWLSTREQPDPRTVRSWPSLKGEERKEFNEFLRWYESATEMKDNIAYGLGKLLDHCPDPYSLLQLLPKEMHSGFKFNAEGATNFDAETSLNTEEIEAVKKECTHLFELLMQVKLMQSVLTKT